MTPNLTTEDITCLRELVKMAEQASKILKKFDSPAPKGRVRYSPKVAEAKRVAKMGKKDLIAHYKNKL